MKVRAISAEGVYFLFVASGFLIVVSLAVLIDGNMEDFFFFEFVMYLFIFLVF